MYRFKRWVREIHDGDSAKLSPLAPWGCGVGGEGFAGLHAAEDGMITLVTLCTIIFFLVLASLVINTGLTMNQKIEVQNTADSVAYSSSLCVARGMNLLTATNHLIGEINSYVVLHEAIGGPAMDKDEPGDANRQNEAKSVCGVAAAAAKGMGADTPLYDDQVTNDIPFKAEATLQDSLINLMQNLTKDYWVKFWAEFFIKVLGKIPYVGPAFVVIGEVMLITADILEKYMTAEWWILTKLLYNFAKATKPIRDVLFNYVMPQAAAYADNVVESIADIAKYNAINMGQQNNCTGAMYHDNRYLPFSQPIESTVGDWLSDANLILPVRPDPLIGSSDHDKMQKSQIVRATYPWVNYNRYPILQVLSIMKFSHARKWYRKWTNEYTIKRGIDFYTMERTWVLKFPYTQHYSLWVMWDFTGVGGIFGGGDAQPQDKGNEVWTDWKKTVALDYLGINLQDQMFCLVGVAHRPAPKLAWTTIYKQPNPDGIVAFAQGMIYNANQQGGSDNAQFQPQIGWDTLNWKPTVDQSNAYDLPDGVDIPTGSTAPGQPQIQLNWQAKLVPLTMIQSDGDVSRLMGRMPTEMQGMWNRMVPFSGALQTH
jgi:hypothetical protein